MLTLAIALVALLASPFVNETLDSVQINPASSDTSNAPSDAPSREEPDFSPGLGVYALLAFGFLFICAIAAIALTALGFLVLSGLIGAGILSASILVGIHQKSFAQGFRTFLTSLSASCGMLVGALCFWATNKAIHLLDSPTALVIGAATGLLLGLLLGVLMSFVVQKFTAFLKNKLKAT